MRKKKAIVQWSMIFMMLIGAGAILYPLGANIYERYTQQRVVSSFRKQVSENGRQQIEREKKNKKYNQDVAKRTRPEISDPFVTHSDVHDGAYDLYESLLGKIVGTIRIPKIDVELPIYFGTNKHQLDKGAGVIPGTSLPVGGLGTHSVITAHRGLQKARMFTDLPELKIGDNFFIDQSSGILAYKINQIVTILPNDSRQIQIVPGKDYVTLLTCTPLGENTHRLLVRGERIPYQKKQEKVNTQDKRAQMGRQYRPLFIVLGIVFLFFLINLIQKWWCKRNLA